MADDTTYTSNRRLNSNASPMNAISFLVENMIKGMVNTAIPVRVDSCTKPGVSGPAGYVSATPLVQQRGADGKSLTPVSLPQLPFFRLQCGTAAVVIDPLPGDVGLAIFAQQDCSNISAGKTDPAQAGSFRCFDMADGFYIGGFHGKTPDTYVELDPEKGEIHVKCPNKITMETKAVEIKADSITLDTPQTTVTGNYTATGQKGGNIGMTGTMNLDGTLTSTGDQTAGGISQINHTHTGVTPGGGDTGKPQ